MMINVAVGPFELFAHRIRAEPKLAKALVGRDRQGGEDDLGTFVAQDRLDDNSRGSRSAQ